MPIRYSPDGQIAGINASSVDDAKLCIKELKLKKKEQGLAKKEVTAEMARVRAEFRTAKAQAGPAPRGKGFLAATGRIYHSQMKHAATVAVDNKISALEAQKNAIDEYVTKIDRAIMGLERWILEHGAK